MQNAFTRTEKIAGAVASTILLICLAFFLKVVLAQGWFLSKTEYSTALNSAEGVWSGTPVQISGIRAGRVISVEVLPDRRIGVRFWIFSKYRDLLSQDSRVYLERSFLIGEKYIDISQGGVDSPRLSPGAEIPFEPTLDLLEMVSAKRLGSGLQTLSQSMTAVESLVKSLTQESRTQAFLETFDQLAPLTKNLNAMAVEVTGLSSQISKEERAGSVVKNLAELSSEFVELLPVVRKEIPELWPQISGIVVNLNTLSTQLVKLGPLIEQLAQESHPDGLRAIEAINEAAVVLKALQKTFLMRSAVREVREEDQQKRMPAHLRKPPKK